MSAQTLPKYKVAINCLVYNHEPYIRDCLEGFVMQQTNFPFVAIVHDDASTDHSAEIIREYAAKYPDILRPIYETENQWSKSDGSLTKIMDAAIDATGAKYVAICEGDDYWTDPLKLQKQVDFLEEHSDYSMCFHSAKVLNETVLKYEPDFERQENKTCDVSDVLERWIVPTASIIYNRFMLQKYIVKKKEWLTRGDMNLVLRAFKVGKVWGMKDCMSVYRMQQNGASKNRELLLKELPLLPNYFKCLYINYGDLDKSTFLKENVAMAYYTRGRARRLLGVVDFCRSFYWSRNVLLYKLQSAFERKLKFTLVEMKHKMKAVCMYWNMDKQNADRKIRIFNAINYSVTNFRDTLTDVSNMWLCRFVRQCDLSLKDGELSIFGIHGHKVVIRMNRSKYKIFFTVENVHVKDSYWERFNDNLINDQSINISLGFDYLEHDKYLRFPFWIMTFLEPNDTIETIREKIKNVNQARQSAWQRRKECPMICRLDYFGDRAYFADEVSKVLEVKYAGIFRHNDDELHKKYNDNKIDYIKQFMFCLCPENSNTKGYVTEKLFDAITAGCFPIYWGSDNMPEPDIVNQEAVIFLKLHGDNVESLAKITRLLTDETYCKKFAKIPVFVEGAEYKMYAYLENLRDKLWRMVK